MNIHQALRISTAIILCFISASISQNNWNRWTPDDGVYDLTGHEVEILFSGSQVAGTHQTFWNSQGAATGSYVLCLESSGELRTQKLILIK